MNPKIIIVKTLIISFSMLLILPSFHSLMDKSMDEIISNELEKKEWTTLFYVNVESNTPFINRIFSIDILHDKLIKELSSGDNHHVLVLQDRRRHPAELSYITMDHTKEILEDLGEISMGDPDTLSDFITYAKTNYPAKRYQLCVWSHANGWYGSCLDETNKDRLTTDELQQALRNSNGVDLLSFIACCLMGSLEVAYEIKDCCDVYIASESPGNGNDWYGMIDDMCYLLDNEPQLTTVSCADRIVDYIGNNQNEFYDDLTISAINCAKVDNLSHELEQLFLILYKNDERLYDHLMQARNESKTFSFIQNSILLDVYDWMQNYQNIETDPEIIQIIDSIKTSFNKMIINEYHGKNQNGSYGLSIFYSDHDLISIYNNSDLDFLSDCHWDELIEKHKENIQNRFLDNFLDIIKRLVAQNPYSFNPFFSLKLYAAVKVNNPKIDMTIAI